MKCYLLSTNDSTSKKLFDSLPRENIDWHWITNKDDVYTCDGADYIFVFRWPYIIDEEVLCTQNFIGFHTSNLPDGRGGSPLHNQIMDGVVETKINAIKLVKEVDAGPIYLSVPITLQGTISDIWSTLAHVAPGMIKKIIKEKVIPKDQPAGSFLRYKRRKNNCVDQEDVDSLEKALRFIQMLDGENYPKAFLNTEKFHIEFERAQMKDGKIICDAHITLKEKA